MLVWKNIKDELPKNYSECLIKVKEKPSDFEIEKGFYPADRVFECAHFATYYDYDYDGKHFSLRDDSESRFNVYLDNEDILEILWVYETDVLSLISNGQ